MNCYVRLIKKARWDKKANSFEEISGEAVIFDWNCINDEWSVYECPNDALSLKKSKQLNNITLKLICDNISKTKSGVELLVLDDEFLDLVQSKAIRDDTDILYCRHCNIKGVNLGKINKAVKYTFENIESKVIKYTVKEIKNLFENYPADYFTEFVRRTKKDNLSTIEKAFNLKEGFFKAYQK